MLNETWSSGKIGLHRPLCCNGQNCVKAQCMVHSHQNEKYVQYVHVEDLVLFFLTFKLKQKSNVIIKYY